MWKCKGCSEVVEDNFDSCWKCGCLRDGSQPKANDNISTEEVLPSGELLSRIVASSTTSRSKTDIAQVLMRRYTDAYVAARWLIGLGGIIKWVAAVLTIIMLVIGIAIGTNTSGNYGFLLGVLPALVIGVPMFILGILISGQGQTHLATLDTAVNTSRHLSKDDVASILVA